MNCTKFLGAVLLTLTAVLAYFFMYGQIDSLLFFLLYPFILCVLLIAYVFRVAIGSLTLKQLAIPGGLLILVFGTSLFGMIRANEVDQIRATALENSRAVYIKGTTSATVNQVLLSLLYKYQLNEGAKGFDELALSSDIFTIDTNGKLSPATSSGLQLDPNVTILVDALSPTEIVLICKLPIPSETSSLADREGISRYRVTLDQGGIRYEL